ncbi:acetyltransferase [Anaerosporobacter sp.]|uniref:acetyltransferase n=1 Tax=Anaerosporobacter sp. TaxID=1872529 RepID=UPI00286F2C2C|nr:acetyltransferase [Anaerosporobacter sp.]
MNKVIILGASGHARSVLDIIRQNNEYEICGLIAGQEETGFWGIPVIGQDSDLQRIYEEGIRYAFVAIGNNVVRKKLSNKLKDIGYELINVISKYAVISAHAKLETGIVVMPGAVINAEAHIGEGCIINTNTSIDHDDIIGQYSHIAPGSSISGSTKIGCGCFLGTGTNVIDSIVIEDEVTVGAGSVVIRNIPKGAKVVGVPAHQIN